MRLSSPRIYSRPWLTIYIASTALVFSFILFEVLDIDGSDFPARPTTAATPATLSEPEHDIRRALVHGPSKLWIDAVVLFAEESWHSVRSHDPAARRPSPVASPRTHGYRIVLARSSLLDVPPSAPLSRS